MQHKVKVTVIDKKVYSELQKHYCADPNVGACPCYHIGDKFIFERYGKADDFWHIGLNTLKQTADNTDAVAGGAKIPHCSEAWDAISRYIYTGLQGGSIMRGWMNDERIMIACCSDGTRPVIFKIERMDYKVIYIKGIAGPADYDTIKEALEKLDNAEKVVYREDLKDEAYIEIYLSKDISDEIIQKAIEACGTYQVTKID